MKRHLRLCLYLLLCLALPINGMAGTRVQAEPCPMLMQHDDGSMMMASSGGDCHDEHESMPAGGHLCKDGHQCKSGSLLQVAAARPPLLPPGRQVPSLVALSPPPFAPEPIWHPPRA